MAICFSCLGHMQTVCLTLLVLAFVFVECNGKHRMEQNRDRDKDHSVTCYECNSEFDPRCGDPFDPYTIGTVNCSMKPKLEHIDLPPTLCRKTIQKVQGKLRIVRACGYVTDERDDKECVRRAGTHDVQVIYCSCSHSLCNTAQNIQISSFTFFSSILFLGFTKIISLW